MSDEQKAGFWALWVEAIRSYWRDPKNVIGPPGSLARRTVKLSWIILSFYVLIFAAIPSQVESWKLWMSNDTLATSLGISFTCAAFLIGAVLSYVAESTKPVRIPLLIPLVEFSEGAYRGWRVGVMHLHLPNVRVTGGALVAVMLFAMSFAGMWNYYLFEQRSTGGVSVASSTMASGNIADAESALNDHRAAAATRAASGEAELARTPEAYATARARIRTANTEQARLDAETDRALAADLREARQANVTVATTASDPRPIDAVAAAVFRAPRADAASLMDAMRSGLVEALVFIGLALGLVPALSRAGVPVETRETIEEGPPPEIVEETPTPPPEEEGPRRRFVLPSATEDDYALAKAVGPIPRPATETPPQEPEAPHAPQGEPEPVKNEHPVDDGDDDPLVRERMARARVDNMEPV